MRIIKYWFSTKHKFCLEPNRSNIVHLKFHKAFSSTSEIQKRKIDLFDKEKQRQASLILDVEKIRVDYEGFPENCTLLMNKHLSTPHDCCLHLSNALLDRSVLALVDDEIWDMCKPLTSDCTLRFLQFKEFDPYFVNKAFWRSLSLMLGAVLENSFKEEFEIKLIGPVPPRVRDGSFAYDFTLNTDSWTPTQDEMRIFSTEMVKLALSNAAFQRLSVKPKLALKMFEGNPFKTDLIERLASKNGGDDEITLYRLGDFVDVNRGPVVAHSGHVGKCTVAAVHPVHEGGTRFYRIQGVALPKVFQMNYYAYSILEENARKLNKTGLSFKKMDKNIRDVSVR